MDQNRPGNCYASMIAPIAGLRIKGAIFHQGYNNCFNGTQGAIMYRQVFPKMITAWRAAFDDPEMPFGILSLCTEGAVQTLDNYAEMMANPGPYIREAQYQTFLDFYKQATRTSGSPAPMTCGADGITRNSRSRPASASRAGRWPRSTDSAGRSAGSRPWSRR